MIDSFPLDYMHLVCLGVVKKLLCLWCTGKPSTKISNSKLSNISNSLIHLAKNIPVEFNRKPRALDEVKRWKATEFRQFLFYTGPIVLIKNVSNDRYLNFLSLHVGLIILSNARYFNCIDYASELLKYFVVTFRMLYGLENISHNVHNLLHITQDVKNHGPLDNFSAFPFENFLQSILRSIRKSDKHLEQIVKRYIETSTFLEKKPDTMKYPSFRKEHSEGPLTEHITALKQFKVVDSNNFILKVTDPDNCCCLSDGTIIVVKNLILSDDDYKILGRKFLVLKDFYEKPCKSSKLGIFLVEPYNLGPLEIFNIKYIAYKCVKLEIAEKLVIFPLIHSAYC
ncbi:uncharacterized protein LOC143187548 [Calliopsis andreniformis]|uniref:uncharacterized protein LOC143187548 n=1 Tax=Calliopsis andreniformis TaxID=337506 RepID=UPI003FCD8C20